MVDFPSRGDGLVTIYLRAFVAVFNSRRRILRNLNRSAPGLSGSVKRTNRLSGWIRISSSGIWRSSQASSRFSEARLMKADEGLTICSDFQRSSKILLIRSSGETSYYSTFVPSVNCAVDLKNSQKRIRLGSLLAQNRKTPPFEGIEGIRQRTRAASPWR